MNRDHSRVARRRHRSWFGHVLLQREMRTRVCVVLDGCAPHATPADVTDDDMIEAFSANGSERFVRARPKFLIEDWRPRRLVNNAIVALEHSIESQEVWSRKTWVQDWVQVARLRRLDLARKLRRVNERLDGYEPGGRRFESCRARQLTQVHSERRGGSLFRGEW
jgi:hypothetical protein